MENFAQLIIEIDIAARKAALSSTATNTVNNPPKGLTNESAARTKGKKRFSALSLKIKLLHLLSSGLSLSSDIIPELCIERSNFAVLTRELISEKLIVKQPLSSDRRVMLLKITQNGADFLNESLSAIEKAALSAFGRGYADAMNKLADAINVLKML